MRNHVSVRKDMFSIDKHCTHDNIGFNNWSIIIFNIKQLQPLVALSCIDNVDLQYKYNNKIYLRRLAQIIQM